MANGHRDYTNIKAILLGALLITFMFYLVCCGCAAGDANGLKLNIFDTTPSRQHFENTQSFARKGEQEAEKAKEAAEEVKGIAADSNSKLEKIEKIIDTTIRVADQIAFWTAVGVPTLAGVATSLKVYRNRKKRKAT